MSPLQFYRSDVSQNSDVGAVLRDASHNIAGRLVYVNGCSSAARYRLDIRPEPTAMAGRVVNP
jgi:hypothetical protein